MKSLLLLTALSLTSPLAAQAEIATSRQRYFICLAYNHTDGELYSGDSDVEQGPAEQSALSECRKMSLYPEACAVERCERVSRSRRR